MTLKKYVADLYLDEDGNFIFREYLLAETKFVKVTPSPTQSEILDWSQSLARLAEREESIKSILKHFMIEKFTTKNKNVEAWLMAFEKESARFALEGGKQIEVFKSCLDSTMTDWFAVCQNKIGMEAPWESWKKNLILTFGDSSWKPVRCAYLYKYLTGSYIDYAIKKEKMLLDLSRDLTEEIILDLIQSRINK